MSEKAPGGFKPPIEQIPFNEGEKLTKWNEILAQVNELKDTLGHGIDDGIKETVVALNIYDFMTSQSCEGHTNDGEKAPWIDFKVQGVNEAIIEAEKVMEEADKAAAAGNPEEEVRALYKKAHAAQDAAEKPLYEKALELVPHLDDFYQGRQVPFDTRLIFRTGASRVRLINQGAMLQSARTAEIQAERLVAYQKEMKEFTEYLKNKYFQTLSG